jgi:hypothetical protein
MKTLLRYLLVLNCLCLSPAHAQTTGNPMKELQAALANLDTGPARIPTRVLLNRMLFITNPHRYAGQGHTTISYNNFEQQYWEFYHSALDTTQLLTLDSLRGTIRQRLQQNELPLVMLAYSYNEFLPTAVQNGLITIDSVNAQVFDGPDLSRSPYATGQLFSAVLPVPVAAGLSSFSLYVGPEFWLGNTPAPELLLDFGDGYGPRKVRMGSTIQVRLASGRPGGATTAGTAPAPVLADGAILTAINPENSLAAGVAFRTQVSSSLAPDVVLGVLASRNWAGFTPTRGVYGPNGRATAIAWIKYANGNTTGKLRRPLVFVEGIDFSRVRGKNIFFFYGIPNHSIAQTGPLPLADFQPSTNPLLLFGGYRNGSAGWDEVVDYNGDFPELEKFSALRERLQAPPTQGFPDGPGGDYDLICLNFSDGATLIQQNARVLVELLQWINNPANRAPNTEETVVVGASMGGRCRASRWPGWSSRACATTVSCGCRLTRRIGS